MALGPIQPLVQTMSGPVIGRVDPATGQHLFLGIPYAQPPIGALRFKPPVPVPAWTDPRPCTDFGPAGTQIFDPSEGDWAEFAGSNTPYDGEGWAGSEDCLTLNIWTKPPKPDALKPVIVWVHGGANWLESSRLATYHGHNLVDRGDVVFVSFNYRLGLFGWVDVSPLLGPSYEGSHVNGLRDQLMALRWIKANIRAFGGDPDSITIMGESAGSIDTSWLLANGHLNDIAARVVLMSGIGGLIGLSGDLHHGFSQDFGRSSSARFLDLLGIKTAEDLLQNTTPDLIKRVVGLNKTQDTLSFMDAQFWPRYCAGFLDTDPFRCPLSHIRADIDIVVGYTAYEMGLWLTWDAGLDRYPFAHAAKRLNVLDDRLRHQAADTYKNAFPDTDEGVRGMHLIGDSIFVIPSFYFADRLSAAGFNVRVYQFDWYNSPRHGAMHAADQTFLFGSMATPAGVHITGTPKDEDDAAARHTLSHTMQDFFLSFAATGTSTVRCGAKDVLWPAYSPEDRAVLSFDTHISVKNDPAKMRREWWYAHVYKDLEE